MNWTSSTEAVEGKGFILSVLCIICVLNYFSLLYSDVTQKKEWFQIPETLLISFYVSFSAAFSECLWRYEHSVSRHSGKHV